MKIGIHGKKSISDHLDHINLILRDLNERKAELYFTPEYFKVLRKSGVLINDYPLFTKENVNLLDLVVSLGGDGTLLESITRVGNSNVPLLGINIGRMGFLATTSKEEVRNAFDLVFENNYNTDRRTLLKLNSDNQLFTDFNYALNDFTILKKDSSSMIAVKVFIDGEYINTYWADGIIVSTPTGSTGYSLSCGGPLIMPGSRNFVITPVSPHNLTTRPLVVPDSSKLSFEIEGRSKNYLCSLDSRIETITSDSKLVIEKAGFLINLIVLPGNSYFKTVRQKLSWGIDYRNY